MSPINFFFSSDNDKVSVWTVLALIVTSVVILFKILSSNVIDVLPFNSIAFVSLISFSDTVASVWALWFKTVFSKWHESHS